LIVPLFKSYIDGEFLKVVIQPWLAEKLRIAAGSLVIVDNVNGKFTITRSAANDEPAQRTNGPVVERLGDEVEGVQFAQAMGHLVPTRGNAAHHF
jgi:hypothetical protein